ncbi:MAG: hypothetical protein NDI60_11510 [Elusimicrobiales bacterium]|nr:hypothetical protein [Elusimicrobiales bacterium]
MALAEEKVKTCPNCGVKLGARTKSGMAAKPASLLLKLVFVSAAFAAVSTLAARPHAEKKQPEYVAPVIESGFVNVKDETIQKIKQKAAKDLDTVGVTDVGYSEDALALYVDQRFGNLSREQQVELLTLIATEWKKAIGKDSTVVNILQHGTKKLLAEIKV